MTHLLRGESSWSYRINVAGEIRSHYYTVTEMAPQPKFGRPSPNSGRHRRIEVDSGGLVRETVPI